MKITVIDTEIRRSYVFNSKIDGAIHIGVSAQCLRNWEAIDGIKYHKQFIICFDTEIIKSKGKIRGGFK